MEAQAYDDVPLAGVRAWFEQWDAGFAESHPIRGILFGMSSGNPLTFAGVPVLLAVAALAACYVPARRAAA